MCSRKDEPGCAEYSFGRMAEECFAFNEALPCLSETLYSVRLSSDGVQRVFEERSLIGCWEKSLGETLLAEVEEIFSCNLLYWYEEENEDLEKMLRTPKQR